VQFAAVGKLDGNAIAGRVFNNVAIGEDVELVVVAEDGAGSRRLRLFGDRSGRRVRDVRSRCVRPWVLPDGRLAEDVGRFLKVLGLSGEFVVFLIALIGRGAGAVPLGDDGTGPAEENRNEGRAANASRKGRSRKDSVSKRRLRAIRKLR